MQSFVAEELYLKPGLILMLVSVARTGNPGTPTNTTHNVKSNSSLPALSLPTYLVSIDYVPAFASENEKDEEREI